MVLIFLAIVGQSSGFFPQISFLTLILRYQVVWGWEICLMTQGLKGGSRSSITGYFFINSLFFFCLFLSLLSWTTYSMKVFYKCILFLTILVLLPRHGTENVVNKQITSRKQDVAMVYSLLDLERPLELRKVAELGLGKCGRSRACGQRLCATIPRHPLCNRF